MANPSSPRKHESASTRATKTDLESHIRALRRYARALVANPDDADDLVQETLKRALTYLDGNREIRNLRSYLLTMLHHARIDHAKRSNRSGEQVPFESCPFLAAGPIQSDHLACNEAVAAINRLPEDQRAVLLLIGLEELAYQETADILGIPIGTVMSRLSRGRKNLRKILHLQDISVEPVSNHLEGSVIISQPPARKPSLPSHDMA